MHSLINTNHIRSTLHVCTRKAKIRTILHLIAYILYCVFQAVKMSIFRIAVCSKHRLWVCEPLHLFIIRRTIPL